MTKNLLHKVYPYIAEQIIQDYGVNKGICLDIGTGPGYIGIEIAKISNLKVYLVDIDSEALKRCEENAKKAGVENQVIPVNMNVERLKFPDNFANLIVSRGSFWFWDNKAQGLKEIYRVLKNGGIGFVGGGLGRDLPERYRKPLVKERENRKNDKKWMRVRSKEFISKTLAEANIDSYKLIFDPPVGKWIEIKKE